MFDGAWTAYVAVTVLAFVFFTFAKRRFDLLTIAFIGALFYFMPLMGGKVLQSSPDLTAVVQPEVYVIATTYMLGLVVAGLVWDRFDGPTLKAQPGIGLSGWYLVLSVVGIAGALVASEGAIVDIDKVEVLKHVGIFYVLFEVAASLAFTSALIERRWWSLAAAAALLVIDLFIGFRVFVTLTALSACLVLLKRIGPVRIVKKSLSYGPAALVLVMSLLLVHTVRFALLGDAAIKSSEMRGDILQYPVPAKKGVSKSALASWASIPLRLAQQSEPFVVQATLVGVVETDLSCRASNIFKSLFLLVPPGMSKFAPENTYPPTFYDEYQPILYPNITYGTAGNIWAEMLCRFGRVGLAVFGILFIVTLVGWQRFLLRSSSTWTAPLALGGVVLAFYINRNDLHYTLVMLRQIGFVFAIAYGLSWARMRLEHYRAVRLGP